MISKGLNNAKLEVAQPVKITLNYIMKANVVPLK
jgi:hypothetical protein